MRAHVSALILLLVSTFCPSGRITNPAEAADHNGLLVSTAVRPAQLSEPACDSTLAREFNIVEAEDAMKCWVLRPDEATYDFRQGDGTRSGAGFRLGRVNEALDESGNVRSSIWHDKPGVGFSRHGANYIEQVFRRAHKAAPHALLFYSEAEGEGLNGKSNAIYSMVKNFGLRGVPINGVGLQMHTPKLDADVPAIAANIVRLTALGAQVHITEVDVSLPRDSGGEARADDLTRHADAYRGIARVCLNSAGRTAIRTWGFTHKYSRIGSHSRGTRGQALPFDRSYRPKAAHRLLLEERLAG
jgi:GH35 family endo-1,4-beta-xylanase